MSIQINIDVQMAKKKVSLTELSERVGISMTNLSLLKTGKVKGIRFATLSKICGVLDCQPGDILEYINEQQ
ncbi:MAG: helix-turn-helix transcriptional regulator [Enterobacterales bacterium]|nr:helix-turn-helix transcriptional regulator [Enterobacterales bacterium]